MRRASKSNKKLVVDDFSLISHHNVVVQYKRVKDVGVVVVGDDHVAVSVDYTR